MTVRASPVRTAVALVATFAATVALGACGGSTAVRASGERLPDTCAADTKGRRIGCLQEATDCGLVYWRGGATLFMDDEAPAEELELPPAEVAATRFGPGHWQVRIDWPPRRAIGGVVASNRMKTQWKITNKQGNLVATATGPQGPLIAMVLLHWGSDEFC